MSELAAGQRLIQGAGLREPPYPRRQSGTRGLVASIFGCLFGLIGVFILAIIFVPLAILCSAIGLLRASRIWIVGVALIGLLLAAAGVVTSPTLLLVAGVLSLLPANQGPASPPITSQFVQRQADKVNNLPPSTADRTIAQTRMPNSAHVDLVTSTGRRFVPLASEPGLHWSQANSTAEWFEITQPMVGCSDVQDSPELQQAAKRSVSAWTARTSLPANCRVFQPGKHLLLDNKQTEAERQQLLKLSEMNYRAECSPFASPVYMPPRRIVGPYLRPSTPPPGWE